MRWYDLFSVAYDLPLERIYGPHRKTAVEALELQPTDRLLLPACGTGQDLPFVAPHVAEVVGVDISAGMLAKAKRRGFPNVTLVEASVEDLDEHGQFDALLWFLGLSVVPRWETLFDATFDRLRPGGRCAIVDVHAERWVPSTTSVSWIAQADLSRKTWTRLEQRGHDFDRRVLSTFDHLHGGTLFLATGDAPS